MTIYHGYNEEGGKWRIVATIEHEESRLFPCWWLESPGFRHLSAHTTLNAAKAAWRRLDGEGTRWKAR